MAKIKEMPRRVVLLPVIKALWMGWQTQRQETGYFCFVLTFGANVVDEGETFNGHLLWARALDTPWRVLHTWEDLTNGEAGKLFADHEALAEWPERTKA